MLVCRIQLILRTLQCSVLMDIHIREPFRHCFVHRRTMSISPGDAIAESQYGPAVEAQTAALHWEDNIKTDLKELYHCTHCIEWVHLAQDRDQWWVILNTLRTSDTGGAR
jgi:hypothetical protein